MPLIFYFIFRKKNNSRELRAICYYSIYSFINDALSYYLFVLQNSKNSNGYVLYNLFTIVEFGCFCYLIAIAINNKRLNKILTGTFILFSILAVANYFLTDSDSITSPIDGIKGVFTICLCIYFFYNQLKGYDSSLLYTTQRFWIIIAFLIYVAGTFFLYLLAENRIKDKGFQVNYFIINSSFIIIKNILLCVAMTMAPPPPTVSNDPDEFLNEDWNNFQSQKNLN